MEGALAPAADAGTSTVAGLGVGLSSSPVTGGGSARRVAACVSPGPAAVVGGPVHPVAASSSSAGVGGGSTSRHVGAVSVGAASLLTWAYPPGTPPLAYPMRPSRRPTWRPKRSPRSHDLEYKTTHVNTI